MSPNEPCKSAEDWQLTAPQEESGTHLALQAYALPAHPRAPPPRPRCPHSLSTVRAAWALSWQGPETSLPLAESWKGENRVDPALSRILRWWSPNEAILAHAQVHPYLA